MKKLNKYEQKKENSQQEYETILIKYENDIKGHIKIEQQLKLLCENLKAKLKIMKKKLI